MSNNYAFVVDGVLSYYQNENIDSYNPISGFAVANIEFDYSVAINTTAIAISNSTANIVISSPTAAQIADGRYYLNANGQWALVVSSSNGGGGSFDQTAQYVFTNTITFSLTTYFGNSSVNSTINSTAFSATANNTAFVGSVSAANVVSNAQLQGNLAAYQTVAGLSVAVAGLTVNNASYLGGTAAGSYQLNSTLAANVAQLTANAATYINANTGIISNATGVFVNAAYINTLTSNVANYINANTGIVSNATGVYVNAAYINTISSNYASYANLASYINANTGIISNATGVYVNPLYIATLLANAAAYIPAGDGLVSNSFGVYVIGNTGIVANSTGVFVNAAYINTISSNLAYYVVANSGIVSNATGVFVNQGTGLVVNSSGVHVNTAYVASISSNYASYANLASYIPANTGIVSNATGVFVNASYINTISSNLAYYVIANTGLISNATGVHVNAAYINTISSNLAYYLGSAGISANTTVLILANTVGISANGSLGTNGQVLTSNGSVAYWAAAGSTGTVSKVYSRTSAAAGQNTFTTSSAFIAGAVDVYLNGVHLSNADFSEINTTTVQLAVNCSAGQIVEIVGYQPSAVTGNVTYGVSISTLSGDGSTVAFGLTTANVTTNSAFVYINGVKQNPGNSYNISANVITFSAAPANNDLIEIQIPQILNATVNTTNIIAIVGNNTVQYGNIAYEVANSTTGNTLSSTVVDSYDATAYRTAKYVVQVTDNSANNYQADEIMLLHDGTNVYITVYGELITNTTIATFDASLVSNNVRLLVTSTSNATIKVHRTMLTV